MELLVELYSEEIPARMQKEAERAFGEILQKTLLENNLSFATVEIYCAARRIAFHVTGLPEHITTQAELIKGPAASAPQKAIEGFCKSHNVELSSLETKLFKEQLCYFYNKPQSHLISTKILSEILPKIISSYSWPKSMHWGEHEISWVRPLKNILCILNGKILPFKYGHLTANDHSYGHSIRMAEAFKVNNFAKYEAELRDNFVILSTKERTNIIKEALVAKTKALNLFYKEDERLLEEVAGLIEYPEIIIGSIDAKFMSLPAEIITTSIRNHQKYFSVIDEKGNLAPYFAFVSNAEANDIIVKGNEKVLTARLADALYFYQKDNATKFASKSVELERMLFHPKLGSMADKVTRIIQICTFLASNNQELLIAAKLCKNDLVSEVVNEFPELQGIMGGIYAKNEGYASSIFDAIRDHYKPLGPKDSLPVNLGAFLALADKLDSLVGLMLAGERATTSGDNYALRRLALGIIRIILAMKTELSTIELIKQVASIYKNTIEISTDKITQIIQFVEVRAKFYFKGKYDANIVSAVLNFEKEDNLFTIENNLEVFDAFTKSSEGQVVLNCYKRIHNILKMYAPDGMVGDVNTEILDQYRQIFCQNLNKIDKNISSSSDYLAEFKTFKYSIGFIELIKTQEFSKAIADLFEHVLIIDPDPVITKNNLSLLQYAKDTMLKIAMFDRFYE